MKRAVLGLASLTLTVGIGLSGCASSVPAPVIERGYNRLDPRADTYTVKRYDTLYSIALEHGVEWQELAAWNGITNPSSLAAGQILRVKPPGGAQQTATTAGSEGVQVNPVAVSSGIEVRPLDGTAIGPAPDAAASGTTAATVGGDVKTEPKALKLPYSEQNLAAVQKSGMATQPATQVATTAPATAPTAEAPPQAPATTPAAPAQATTPAPTAVATVAGINWSWPTAGTVMAKFSEGGSKGLQIGGRLGEPILASANGKVTYVGDGVRGYGNLVIVKHNDEYLSVYAHNRRILVQSGQMVSKGQKIAEMGNGEGNKPLLHFEIRRFGKPVDPLQFLPNRAG